MTEHPPYPQDPDQPERPAQQYPSYQAPPSYGQNPYGVAAYGAQPVRDHPQATTILVLGIVGLVLCGLAAPFAWVMGGRARREIQASHGQLGGLQQVTIGWILGIIVSVLMILAVVLGFGLLAVAFSSSS